MTLNTKIIISAKDNTQGGISSASRGLRTLSAQAAKIGVAFSAGAATAAAGIALIVRSQSAAIDSQAKLAQRLNTTYESLANLGRAGELAGVGMSQIETASRQLDLNLGKAIQGTKAQSEAFERLGLSARQIADLPLDKRLAVINQALRDNVSAAERSAVAADIFGAKNAAAIQALNPETIAEAARQVEIFGLSLSDVDAAKVEMANDAMSTFGLLTDGIGKQLTVELAPVLNKIGQEFLRSAEEAGGLGTVVQDTVRRSVDGLAFVVDAADGLRRVFQLLGRSAAVSALGMERGFLTLADSIVTGPIAAVNDLINVMNRLPGVQIQTVGISRLGASIRSQIAVVEGAIREGITDIQEIALQPLAGDSLRRAYAAAQEAGQLQAEANVASRRASNAAGEAAEAAAGKAGKATKAVREQVDTVQRQIDALFRQAATFNMSATEAKLYELSMDGATESQLRQASSLLNSIDAMKAAADETARLNALLDATPTAQLESLRGEMALLERAFLAGKISAEQFVEAAQTRLGTLPEKIKEAADTMTVFADQAARNMQTAFADFLFDPFEGGVRGMLTNFVTAIRRMSSELLASQLLNMLGGSLKNQGGFLGALGTAMTGIKPRATGGPVSAGGTYLVGERGPELFTPRQSGAIVPNNQLRQQSSQTNVRIVNAFDSGVVGDFMGSDSGEQIIMNVVSRNSASIRQLVA
jgi:hypothetical protein